MQRVYCLIGASIHPDKTAKMCRWHDGILAQVTGCNAALSCCFAASQWEKVFELLDAMVEAKMDGTSAKFALKSCGGSAVFLYFCLSQCKGCHTLAD